MYTFLSIPCIHQYLIYQSIGGITLAIFLHIKILDKIYLLTVSTFPGRERRNHGYVRTGSSRKQAAETKRTDQSATPGCNADLPRGVGRQVSAGDSRVSDKRTPSRCGYWWVFGPRSLYWFSCDRRQIGCLQNFCQNW